MPADLLDPPTAPVAKAPAKPEQPAPSAPGARIEDLLGASAESPWRRRLILLIVALLLVGAGIAAERVFVRRGTESAAFETAPIRRGDLNISVTATGTLAPVNQVDVGSELSGTIERVLVDDNDHVRKGQILAELDTSKLRDQIALGVAAVDTAKAQLAEATATVLQARLQASRKHSLYGGSRGQWPAKADVDAADADLARAVAAADRARATIGQAQATLNTNRTNLAKAVIRSPVDGVVLNRRIEVGQTVAAALQAPVLFTIAEDMRRMELDADIDEADVGEVQAGQAAVFNVDAYPGRQYPATVTRVGLGSQTKEGVVTYKGVLSVDNADLSLRPGMTASADIRTARRTGVLIVPDAALRFQPPAKAPSQGLGSALVPRMPRLGPGPQRRSADADSQHLWVLQDGEPRSLAVRAGASDGHDTEVSGRQLHAGMAVIIAARESRR